MLNEDQYDLDKMDAEVCAETDIGTEIFDAGHSPFLPLANSIPIEESNQFTGQQFVAADLVLVQAIDPDRAFIVLRDGWSNNSEGAALELAMAIKCAWIIYDMEEMTVEELRKELKQLLMRRGPCVGYVAGKYRWLKEAIKEFQETSV